MGKILTRRDFLKGVTVTSLGLAVGLKANPLQKSTLEKTKVVVIRHKNAVDANMKFNQDIIQKMIDEAVMKLTNEKDPVKAFSKIIKPKDILGIKTNSWKFIPTPKEVENAIKKRALDVGITEENISVDDRGVLNNPVFAKATALINARTLRTHYWAGLGTCIKNYIMFDPVPEDYHPDSCADLAKLWSLPLVKDKTRLNIMVALTPLFNGKGPHHYDNRYVWNYNGLIIGFDPVAVDSVALKLIKAKRVDFLGEEGEWQTPPKHIELAETRHKLGIANLEKIEIIKLGWQKDVLI